MKKSRIQIARSKLVIERLEKSPRTAFKKNSIVTEADRRGGKSNGKISTNLLRGF